MSELIDQYNNELKEHLVLDEFNIKDAQMKLPGRKHLWVGRLMRHKQELNNLKTKKSKLIQKITKSIQESSAVRLSVPAAEKVAWNTEPIKELSSTNVPPTVPHALKPNNNDNKMGKVLLFILFSPQNIIVY